MPFFVIMLLIQAAFMVISGLLAKKPDDAKPETDFDFPQIDRTRPLPVIFGECVINDAQLLDYFDVTALPIKKRIWFGVIPKTVILGYKYYMGMVFGLGWGAQADLEAPKLTEVRIDNRSAIGDGTSVIAPFGYVNPIFINNREYFGKEKQEGGLQAKLVYYDGNDYEATSSIPLTSDAYWEAQAGETLPNYKNIAYVVWYGPSAGAFSELGGSGFFSGIPQASGWIGNRPNLWPLSFKVYRQPTPFGGGEVERPSDEEAGAGRHANPISCLYEVLTNDLYGAGISSTLIDYDGFVAAATTCWSEGLGFSYLWTTASPVQDMIGEILRFVDGVLYTDLTTGKIKIKLARPDYDVEELETVTNADFVSIDSFTRGSREDTKNELRVTFTDHSTPDFADGTVYWNEIANYQMQGAVEPYEIRYRGCPSATQANRLAARDGRVLSLPLARLSGKLNRKKYNWTPGHVFKLDWPEQGISGLVMRVSNMKLGTVKDGVIDIVAVEDVYEAGIASYGTPDTTNWTDPIDGDPEASPNAFAAELPYFFQHDDLKRVFGGCERPTPSHVGFDFTVEGETVHTSVDFAASGTLQDDYDQMAFDPANEFDTLVVENVTSTELLHNASTVQIREDLYNLGIIGDPNGVHEWIAYQDVEIDGTTVTLTNVWRGLFDTPPIDHVAGTRVWFLSDSMAFSDGDIVAADVDCKHLTKTFRGTLDPDDATNYNVEFDQRALRPLPPYGVKVNFSFTNEIVASGDIRLDWYQHSRLAMTTVYAQNYSDLGKEDGATWEIDIYGDGVFIRTESGLTTGLYEYTEALQASDGTDAAFEIRFDMYGERDGLRSFRPFQRYVYRDDPSSVTDAVQVGGVNVTVNGTLTVVT